MLSNDAWLVRRAPSQVQGFLSQETPLEAVAKLFKEEQQPKTKEHKTGAKYKIAAKSSREKVVGG